MRGSRRQDALASLLFLSPFLFTLIVFFVYAFVNAVRYSFTEYDLFNPPTFVGLSNYIQLFQESLFQRAVFHTVAYSVIVTAVQVFLALALAALLNQRLRGIYAFRTIYYLPSVLSSAAVTLIFLWLYQRNGFINFAISWVSERLWIFLAFGVIFVAVQALQVALERRRGVPTPFFDPALASISVLVGVVATTALWAFGVVELRAMGSVEIVWLNTRERFLGVPVPLWAIMLQNIYTTIPTFMLLYLAGLQDIPRSLYEAASVDGATPLQQFFRITVPMLRPVTFLVVTLSLIGTLQVFDQIALFGDAAPIESKITLAFYVYDAAFPSASASRIGEASAAALVLGVLTLLVVLLQRALGISNEEAQ